MKNKLLAFFLIFSVLFTFANIAEAFTQSEIESIIKALNLSGPNAQAVRNLATPTFTGKTSAVPVYSPAVSNTAPKITLSSVTINPTTLNIVYSKNFTGCVELSTATGLVLPAGTIDSAFCYYNGSVTNAVLAAPRFNMNYKYNLAPTSGQSVRLCKKGDYSVCSNFVTVNSNSVSSANSIAKTNTATDDSLRYVGNTLKKNTTPAVPVVKDIKVTVTPAQIKNGRLPVQWTQNYSSKGNKMEVKLIDTATNKAVFSKVVSAYYGSNSYTIPTAGLKTGNYMVSICDEDNLCGYSNAFDFSDVSGGGSTVSTLPKILTFSSPAANQTFEAGKDAVSVKSSIANTGAGTRVTYTLYKYSAANQPVLIGVSGADMEFENGTSHFNWVLPSAQAPGKYFYTAKVTGLLVTGTNTTSATSSVFTVTAPVTTNTNNTSGPAATTTTPATGPASFNYPLIGAHFVAGSIVNISVNIPGLVIGQSSVGGSVYNKANASNAGARDNFTFSDCTNQINGGISTPVCKYNYTIPANKPAGDYVIYISLPSGLGGYLERTVSVTAAEINSCTANAGGPTGISYITPLENAAYAIGSTMPIKVKVPGLNISNMTGSNEVDFQVWKKSEGIKAIMGGTFTNCVNETINGVLTPVCTYNLAITPNMIASMSTLIPGDYVVRAYTQCIAIDGRDIRITSANGASVFDSIRNFFGF